MLLNLAWGCAIVLDQVHFMSGTALGSPPSPPPCRLRAAVRRFAFSRSGEAGEIDTVTLIVILLAPLVIMGGLAFVLIIAYANRLSRITPKDESKPKPTVCPACGHKLVEIRRFCAECGASIWPPEPEQPDVSPEKPT